MTEVVVRRCSINYVPLKISQNFSFTIKNRQIFSWRLSFTIVYKKTDEWYIEWQRMTGNDNEWYTSGITSDIEWQQMTTSDKEWQQVVQPVTKSDKKTFLKVL